MNIFQKILKIFCFYVIGIVAYPHPQLSKKKGGRSTVITEIAVQRHENKGVDGEDGVQSRHHRGIDEEVTDWKSAVTRNRVYERKSSRDFGLH